MPFIQNLSKSTRNVIDQPNIIPRSFDYVYESFTNTPKMILIIENKLLNNNLLNELALNDDKLTLTIDYTDTNPNHPSNIFNYMNLMHSEMIKMNDLLNGGRYKNSYFTNNYNFAYHYFIDKMGNIYEGRPHTVRPYNLDIYDTNYPNTDEYKQQPSSEKEYDPNTGRRVIPLLNQGDFVFTDCLIILTEEQTDEIDTTNATYTALKSLINYLRQVYNYKKFYTYSELKMITFNSTDDPREDLSYYNNPGLFFKVNELHSAVDRTPLKDARVNEEKTIILHTYGNRVLKKQEPIMKGNDVLMLQRMLYKLELLPNYKNINGYFDLQTKLSVTKFQKKYYIKPEFEYGVADKNTLLTLRDKIYKEKMSNIKLIDQNYKPFRVLEYIEGNPMVGQDILILQNKLKRIIYPILKVNGIFDEYTKDAVSMFQARYSLYTDKNMDDGVVGPETWRAINECKDIIFRNIDSSESEIEGAITPTSHNVSKSGILYLQRALNEMLKVYSISIPLTGGYDELTQRYIKMINENEQNRKTIGLDKYDIDWELPENPTEQEILEHETNLKTCWPAEFIWLIKHYLLKEDINLELVY